MEVLHRAALVLVAAAMASENEVWSASQRKNAGDEVLHAPLGVSKTTYTTQNNLDEQPSVFFTASQEEAGGKEDPATNHSATVPSERGKIVAPCVS